MLALTMSLQWMLFAVAGLMGLSAWLVYLWAVQDGQFKSIEDPAERLLSQVGLRVSVGRLAQKHKHAAKSGGIGNARRLRPTWYCSRTCR